MDEFIDDVGSAGDGDSGVEQVSGGNEGSQQQSEDGNFEAMQKRMEAGDPWYSDSVDQVLTPDGEPIINPITGKPFKSMDEWNSAQQQPSKETAKPKTEEPNQAQKPLSKSFDAYVFGEEGFSPDRIRELSKAGSGYTYNNQIAIKATPDLPGSAAQKAIDPIEQVRKNRDDWSKVIIDPLKGIREALIKSGGVDPAAADSFIAPFLQKATDELNKVYQEQFEKAMVERSESQVKPLAKQAEAKLIESESRYNINRLSTAYYPNGGKDQFFSLINGHNDESGKFVPGPAAHLINLLTRVANRGKKFSNDAEISSAYNDTFKQIMADPDEAQVLFDIVHKYYIGSNFDKAQGEVFKKGKDAAKAESQRIQTTIKTKPSGYSPAPSDQEDDIFAAVARHQQMR